MVQEIGISLEQTTLGCMKSEDRIALVLKTSGNLFEMRLKVVCIDNDVVQIYETGNVCLYAKYQVR